jgi:hypothetical protein
MKQLVGKYHDVRVELAALREAGKKSGLIDVLSVICLGVGAAGLGAGPGYFSIPNAQGFAWTIIVGSGVLVVAGLISPVVNFISRVTK